ncbi:MAG: hypothetical protein HFJ48_04550 [Clostridia bacterium]|nr:hypothetical protein [Clostridia bacterium]
MENTAEALKIAFGVLIFVLALSISISGFTQARMAVSSIVANAEEGETFVKDANGKYLNYVDLDIESGGTRTVGVDTVVSTMYRAYKENFKIYFYGIDSTAKCGLQYDVDTNTNEKIYYIDLARQTIAPGKEEEYLNEILSANSNQFYKYLAGKKFTEKLGEYYQNDEDEASEISDVNKTKKRIIIYRVQN